MTTIRITAPHVNVTRLRALDARWGTLSAFCVVLGLIGGFPLIEQVAVMIARVLFIAGTLTFLITMLLFGLGVVRRATE